MTTKERIQKARDLQATASHHLSLAYLQLVKDCLKKNSTFIYYQDRMGSQFFVDRNDENISIRGFIGGLPNGGHKYIFDDIRPSLVPLSDFLDEFPDACLPNGIDIVYA